jgi:hypothetical protein
MAFGGFPPGLPAISWRLGVARRPGHDHSSCSNELVAMVDATSTLTARINRRCRHLLDDFVRPLQQRRRDRQPERLGGFEIDDQLELRRLLHG